MGQSGMEGVGVFKVCILERGQVRGLYGQLKALRLRWSAHLLLVGAAAAVKDHDYVSGHGNVLESHDWL